MGHTGFQHQALIYEGAGEYLAGTVPFIEAALQVGEPVMAAVSRSQAELLARALGPASRRVEFAPMEEVGRNPAALVPLWRDFVAAGGGRPVCGISEATWPERGAAGLEECHRSECLLNVAFADGPGWSLLCPYDACALTDVDEVLEKAARTHRYISREGRTECSAAFDPDPDCLGGALPSPSGTPGTLSFGLGELAEVRRCVTAAAERVRMDRREVADFVTAVSELAANSVMHGGGSGALRVWREDDCLLAEVTDRGRIEEPLVGRVRPDISQEGGRGLWLANQLCDLVQIRSDAEGTTVRLHTVAHQGTSPGPFGSRPLGLSNA
ncbi:MAG TPA: anti-sigma factor RsbA family regulatory protein [Solirubrobacterales bacterium]|nr:anti-sigma factor RsbA family regulatory protein [Solirubrobacterales bacterium]